MEETGAEFGRIGAPHSHQRPIDARRCALNLRAFVHTALRLRPCLELLPNRCKSLALRLDSLVGVIHTYCRALSFDYHLLTSPLVSPLPCTRLLRRRLETDS